MIECLTGADIGGSDDDVSVVEGSAIATALGAVIVTAMRVQMPGCARRCLGLGRLLTLASTELRRAGIRQLARVLAGLLFAKAVQIGDLRHD